MTAEHFEAVAEGYAAARPTYPAELFDALELRAGLRVLEIGPGTGQATRDLAARGVELTCYEQGPTLAAMTAAAVPSARVINAPAATATGSYDLVCGFTSLHWLGDDLWPLAHRLLVPGGRLAHIGTLQVTVDPDSFGPLEPVFRRHFGWFHPPPHLEELTPLPWDEALFERSGFEVFPREARYDGAGFAKLFATYSPIGALPEPQRSEFLAELAASVDAQGGLTHRTANVLNVFTRR